MGSHTGLSDLCLMLIQHLISIFIKFVIFLRKSKMFSVQGQGRKLAGAQEPEDQQLDPG